MKLRNLPGYVLILATLTSVMVAFTGCGVDAKKEVKKATVPDMGGHVVLARADDGWKLVTLHEGIGAVCIESAATGGRISRSETSFSCWDMEKAPKKIQELIDAHNKRKNCDVGLSC